MAGAWYNARDPNDPNQRVATYRYDGLFRRTEKVVGNQGVGIVYNSDKGSVTGIQAGNRHEHYFYSGWRLVETTDHASGDPYVYGSSHVLGQFVYGTQYIDEPVCYDRNLDPNTDSSCIEAGDARYFYHQDANFRVVMLTGENGSVVERYEYTAYGEPTVYGGYSAGAGDELGNAQLVSNVGNPLQHQGLFRDREINAYQNRFREYHSRAGRFMQRDPLGSDDSSLYEYVHSAPTDYLDPLGLQTKDPGAKPKPAARPEKGDDKKSDGKTKKPEEETKKGESKTKRPNEITGSGPPAMSPDSGTSRGGSGITEYYNPTDDGTWVTNCAGYALGCGGIIQPVGNFGRISSDKEMQEFLRHLGCTKKKDDEACPAGTTPTRWYRNAQDSAGWHVIALDGADGKACDKDGHEGPVHTGISDPDAHAKARYPGVEPVGTYCCKTRPVKPLPKNYLPEKKK